MSELTPEFVAQTLAEATPGPWGIWDGWGPAHDGLMRFMRIGDAGGNGLTTSNDSFDIAASRADAELCAIATELAQAFLDLTAENAALRENAATVRSLALAWEREVIARGTRRSAASRRRLATIIDAVSESAT